MNTREIAKNYRLNQWTEIIRECRSSGQTVNAWCANHGINPKSYYYWLRRVREAAGTNTAVQDTSSQIILRFGAVTLELRNNASTTLIENALRALQNDR